MKSFTPSRTARRVVSCWHRRPVLENPAWLRYRRQFHATALLQKTETHILSDIGEGVKEVQIIQWFVEEGATVEEWAPLCEVQSDKASVEITSKYAGVIKKLHFDRDAVVQVGDAMLDIEVEGEDDAEPEAEEVKTESKLSDGRSEERSQEKTEESTQKKSENDPQADITAEETPQQDGGETESSPSQPKSNGKHASLATPAVRGLLKQHKLEITAIEGTGKDGRVMKEDVIRHVEQQKQPKQDSKPSYTPATSPALNAKQEETQQNLTPIQSAMFKSMTKSLTIPHFLYSDTIDVTSLAAMRSRLNERRDPSTTPKFTYMPFVIKAVSLALNRYPLLNARLDTSDKPKLLMRMNHNIGVAMDTPAGLVVPVIKTVNARSIVSIATDLYRLADLGAAGKLTNEDLSGGTITVSNIGNIGGGVVAPVILENQLAIMGMGKIKPTPIFAKDGKTLERADMLSTSWSADHRVVDGATMARMASLVQQFLEQPEMMMVEMN